MASLQFKAFRERFDDLVKGVQVDLNGIASRAYAKKLITLDTLQTVTNQQNDIAQRSMNLVSSVHKSINVSENNFAAFVAILKAEPAVSGLAHTLERTLYGLREGPRMEGKVAGSSTAGVGGATAMDLDSGVADADTSALSEATNGDMMPPEAELVSLRNSSPPPDQSEGGADQSDYDSRQRNSTFRQEVGQGGGADALVTTPHDRMPRVGPSASLDDKYNTRMGSSMSSADEAVHNLRMEVLQQKTEVSELQSQVTDLNQKLEKTTNEKSEALRQLESKEAEVRKITERKDTEIQEMRTQIQELHVQIEVKEEEASCYQRRIAEKEKENDEQRQRHEMEVRALVKEKDTVRKELQQTKCDYEKEIKKMERKLEDANACKEEAAIKLSQVKVSLANKEAEYNKLLFEHEQEIGSLRLQVAKQTTREANMRADLAEFKLTIEKLRRRSAEKKHRDSPSRVEELEKELARLKLRMNAKIANYKAEVAEMRQKEAEEKRQQAEKKQQAMEERLREEQEKRRNSEAEAEKKRLDSEAEAEKKRLDSEAEAEKKRLDSEAEAEKRLREEQKKRRDSEAELGELRAKLAQLGMAPKMPHLPEYDADSCM